MSMDPVTKKRASRFILLTVFIYSMGFGIIMPVLPDLIRELEGVSLAEAARYGAWIGAMYAAFQFLCGPLAGNLGDRFGRRPIFLISLFGFGIDFMLMGLAPNILWLFAGRAIAGGLGAIFGPANAAMADMSSAEDRAKSFGLVGAAFGVGFIFGPAIGGMLGSATLMQGFFGGTLGLTTIGEFLAEHSTRVPFFVAAAMALMNAVYGFFVFPETLDPERRRPFILARANPLGALSNLGKIKGILPIALIYFLWVFAGNVYPTSWTFFAQAQYGWGSDLVGVSLTLVGLSMLIVQAFVIGRMVTRFGERKTAYAGMVGGLIVYGFLAFVTNGTLGLLLVFLGGVQGVTQPALNAMMSQRTPPNQQGELQGMIGSMTALSFFLSHLAYNNVFASFTEDGAPIHFPGATFILAITATLIAIIGLALVSRRPEA
jgi:DHA1 family tetracycline resistance protein-like MFS transporter